MWSGSSHALSIALISCDPGLVNSLDFRGKDRDAGWRDRRGLSGPILSSIGLTYD